MLEMTIKSICQMKLKRTNKHRNHDSIFAIVKSEDIKTLQKNRD